MLGIVPQTRLAGYLTPSPTHKAAGVQCASLQIKSWNIIRICGVQSNICLSPPGGMMVPHHAFSIKFCFFSPLAGQKSGIRRCNPLKIIVK